MHARPRPRARFHARPLLLALALAAGCSPGGSGGEGERDDARATLTLEPRSGPPGTDVQVRVAGFPPDVAVDVGFGPPGEEHRLLSRSSTGSEGTTAAAVRVPDDAAPGRPYLFVAAYAPALLRLADTFRVTAPAPARAPADTLAGGRMDTDTAGGAAPAGETRVTGRLTDEGVECPALRGDDGRLYTLAGDTGGFKPGDRVTVAGTVAEMSTCMQGTTISVRSIEKAGNRE
ncbi:MAG TPA: DUF5818 domain-containing protein [Longimicrobiaceae bacterium]|jgi:hypothetical protein